MSESQKQEQSTHTHLSTDHTSKASHLFLVRLWADEVEGQEAWSGKVQHVLSGEVRPFSDWSMLASALRALLPDDAPEATKAEAGVALPEAPR